MDLTSLDPERLASFPEQNPNPVVELTIDGAVTYHNPAAARYFPDIGEKGLSHPLFMTVRNRFGTADVTSLSGDFSCEVEVNGKVFEQKLYYLPGSRLVRVYSSDITIQKETEKKLAHLALFPEQNPNPVVEADCETRIVTYHNPAAKLRFPDLKTLGMEHPLLCGIDVSQQRDFQREVQIGGAIFEQKVYFIQESSLMRVYSHDITQEKEIQKSLRRLASFPEQNPSPIVEADREWNITYLNPAARTLFPDVQWLKWEHPLLAPMVPQLEKLKSGQLESYTSEISIGGRHYLQRARYMADSELLRIFNNDITQQKVSEQIIREKNQDITDSINYARKIQRSLLPADELIPPLLSEHFILYSPKDIISGDFYWFSQVNGYFLFACADCTGHGVPGALVSMIGSSLLSLIVSEKQITTPAGVLFELDRRMRKALRQDEEKDNRDGMDIAFCSLHPEKRILHYAGANRPLVIIRNGEITEQEATRLPIGGSHEEEKRFSGQTIQLQPGDRLYLFSDGIADQFGGPNGKKFMKRRFYELLLSLQDLKMSQQRTPIHEAFNDWKGELEQTDDVCVLGFGIP